MTRLFLAAGVAALAIAASANARPGDTDRTTAKAERIKDSGARRAQATERRATRTDLRTARTDRSAGVTRVAAARPDRARVEARKTIRADRQAVRTDRAARTQDRAIARAQPRADRQVAVQQRIAARDQLRSDRQIAVQDRIAVRQDLRASRLAALNARAGGTILAPATAAKLVGQPLAQVSTVAALSPLPLSVQYLYPDTPDYYYRYGNGYVYQVDRDTDLISMLLPLLIGGYLPGQYLPNNYMNSYVPTSFSAFYPNTSSQCTRYVNGVIYYVDCQTGLIENFMPLYDNGYGVGQMLPSGYGYYNVPYQYRDLYYNSADTGYWYAPGAIYQYDTKTSLITAIAALLSPGMSIGQPLPMGYSAYNVPLGFRETYYDTPDHWYRYSNGNIYQVDPATLLVTALVASALT